MGYSKLQFDLDSSFLVTGAAGFIGSNIVEALLKLGYRVRGIDNFSNGKRKNVNLFNEYKNYEFIEGDIRDIETCMNACEGIDYVLHQAALGSVPRSMKEPLIYEDNNVKGTVNMMEAARCKGIKRFVYASSSSVYGDSETLPKIEGYEGNVLSPYALSKKVNEYYGKLYFKVYGLECIGLRYFNVFGRRQNPDGAYAAVIPKFIRQILNGERPTINGDGNQSRDFTYIENVIEANLKACLAPKKACGKAFNIAYGGQESLNNVFECLVNALDVSIKPMYGPERCGDIKHSNASIDKARELLGYEPQYSFSQGINIVIEWYKEYLQLAD